MFNAASDLNNSLEIGSPQRNIRVSGDQTVNLNPNNRSNNYSPTRVFNRNASIEPQGSSLINPNTEPHSSMGFG